MAEKIYGTRLAVLVSLLVVLHGAPGQSAATKPDATDGGGGAQHLSGSGPTFLGADLTSNRYNALPNDRLQVITFYDGIETNATLTIEVRETATGTIRYIDVHATNVYSDRLDTFEYDLNGHVLTYNFRVSGVVPNGVIDGLAFGVYWKDSDGTYRIIKSVRPGEGGAHFVGAWPLGVNDGQFLTRTPQITDGIAREHARAVLYGAALLPNGNFSYSSSCAGASLFDDGFETGDTSAW